MTPGLFAMFKLDHHNKVIIILNSLRSDFLNQISAFFGGGTLLQKAEYHDWSDVPCLSFADSFSEKLLSNSDRWADRAVKSKDLIDLSMLRLQSEIPETSVRKAESAYPVMKPLEKSVRIFQSEPDYRTNCFSSLQIQNKAKILDGLDLLASDFGISSTKRKDDEYPDF